MEIMVFLKQLCSLFSEDKDSPRDSIHSEGLDTMPAEMFVPNQEQWLELRVPKQKGLCGGYSLCCSS